MKIKIILALTLFLTAASSSAQPLNSAAPFGLAWGAKKADLENLFDCHLGKKALEYCYLRNPPNPMEPDAEYLVIIDQNAGLVKANYLSPNIKNDPEGKMGIARFNQLKSLIKQKHPTATSEEFIYQNRKLYEKKDQFYQCLAFSACGNYSFFLSTPNGVIATLELYGNVNGDGYIIIRYESPQYAAVQKENSELKFKERTARRYHRTGPVVDK